MKILLDENVPNQLRDTLEPRDVSSVNDRVIGWKNISNGRLLAEMEGRFDLLITSDRNIYAQQNLRGRSIANLVLPTNRRNDVLKLVPRIAAAIDAILPGQYALLEKDGTFHVTSF
ncbi:hypothetical protein RPMA_05310 [Tardiphaga alba]|uniref:DUF5615 domain-containing protein n=1 Tax=Tardiphaga alba TaxID=340268 RepID=A0ABX8A3W1_9BRAD|nr:hypothetical protein [Tardiphaga alba]QUS38326.1 hypothetical protein RPMA_05310 [Tardiphaga alba]